MLTANHVTDAPIALARKARHRRPTLCTCCARHILIQLSQRRSVRAIAVVTAIAWNLFMFHHAGMI